MFKYNKIISYIFILNLCFTNAISKAIPDSFADLAERLMPSVVNISTTQTIKTSTSQLPFQFPPGSPFEEMFKDFQRPTERKASSLGSGFIINKNGTVIKPPPIPNKPATNPTGIAVKAINKPK